MKNNKSQPAVASVAKGKCFVLCILLLVIPLSLCFAEKVETKPDQSDVEKELKDVLKNKYPELLYSLTEDYKQGAQELLDYYCITGTVVSFLVVAAEYNDGILYLDQVIVWHKPNDDFGILRYGSGIDIKTNKLVKHETLSMNDLTRGEILAIRGVEFKEGVTKPVVIESEDSKEVAKPSGVASATDSNKGVATPEPPLPSPTSQSKGYYIYRQNWDEPTSQNQSHIDTQVGATSKSPSFYERNKKEIDTAGIGVAAAAATAVIGEIIKNVFDSAKTQAQQQMESGN